MASRGLRITKDVAAAWTDMSCGLMERIDSHEDHVEELKEYVSGWALPKCIRDAWITPAYIDGEGGVRGRRQ